MSKDTTDAEREKRLVGAFIFMEFTPGLAALTPEHVEAIKAAQQRLFRQAQAASHNGRKGAPKVVKTDKRAVQLREAKRRQREREKEK